VSGDQRALEGSGQRYDYLIVGAGFAGSVLAERLASQHNARVLLIDRRPHVGGNAYDEPNEAGILYHKYGPHIFHTNGVRTSTAFVRSFGTSLCRSQSTGRR
jgi:UDP-galactopyranose mutase